MMKKNVSHVTIVVLGAKVAHFLLSLNLRETSMVQGSNFPFVELLEKGCNVYYSM